MLLKPLRRFKHFDRQIGDFTVITAAAHELQRKRRLAVVKSDPMAASSSGAMFS
jgi:hypothetical protein